MARGSPRCSRRHSFGGWLGLLGAALVLAVAPPALAWNAHGHMLVALLAYDSLSEGKRATLARLLQAHPRYHQDLLPALPATLGTDAERSRWLFAIASTWPDIVSRQPEYAHGTWHYVNLPLWLQDGTLTTCREARRRLPESRRRILQLDAERRARGEPGIPAGDSILEALPNNQRTLADPAAPAEARALALSWVLHLVGDAHQPLHAVAVFAEKRFASGDRGGNDINILDSAAPASAARSLHRVWDELLGADTTPAALDAALAGLRGDRQLSNLPTAAIAVKDVAAWVDEDCELARSSVYVPAILREVSRFERHRRPPASPSTSAAGSATPSLVSPGVVPSGVADKPQLSLRRAYFTHAAYKARERAVLAGLRLATLLDAAL
jgi:hypothetical protein